jgi:hypothetical protein
MSNNRITDSLIDLFRKKLTVNIHFKPGKKISTYLLRVPEKESARKQAIRSATTAFKLYSNATPQPEVIDREDYFLLRGPDDLKAKFYIPSNHFSFYREKSIYSGVSQVTDKIEAQKIAKRFLKNQPLISLKKDTLVFEKLRFIKGIGVNVQEKVATKPILHNTIAIFSSTIDGKMRITGPGSRIVVFLGNGKEVVGFKAYARKVLSKFQTVTIDPPDMFIGQVVSRIQRNFGANGFEIEDINVENFECAYFAQGKHVLQRFLQPAYVIAYTVKNKWMNSGNIIVRPAHSKEIEILEGPDMDALAEEQKRQERIVSS